MTMHSSSRNGAQVIWLGIHTTEGIMRAKDLRDWTSWAGSSHAANDETGVLMTPRDGFVPYDRAAWTLRNGNPISENLEQCGWARWTRAEWLARPKLLDTTALWLADRSRARGIPLRLLTPAEIRGRKTPGVLGHGHYSTATGDGTHWDPGPNYPWDVVLAKAKWLLNPTPLPAPVQEDDQMNAAQEAKLDKLVYELTTKFPSRVAGSTFKDTAVGMILNTDAAAYRTERAVAAQQATIKEMAKALGALAAGDDLDVDALLARIGEKIDTAVGQIDAALDDAAKLVKVQVSVDDAAAGA